MFKLLSHPSSKNVKILKRELAFAHTSIVLLALGIIAIIAVVDSAGGLFNHTLAMIAIALLAIVVFVSVAIVGLIIKTKK